MKIKVWREQASEIPALEADRLEWLHRKWQRLDGWLDEVQTSREHGASAGAAVHTLKPESEAS